MGFPSFWRRRKIVVMFNVVFIGTLVILSLFLFWFFVCCIKNKLDIAMNVFGFNYWVWVWLVVTVVVLVGIIGVLASIKYTALSNFIWGRRMDRRSFDELIMYSTDIFGYDVDESSKVIRLLARSVDSKIMKQLNKMGYKVEIINIKETPKAMR